MTDKSMKALLRKREQKIEDAGGGLWFRRSDGRRFVVTVTFYPKTKLRLRAYDAAENTAVVITRQELEANYTRLEV